MKQQSASEQESMALTAMRQHWQFWQEEYEAARENGDAKRVEECKRYIRRCVIVIDALMESALPPMAFPAGAERWSFLLS